MTGSDIELAKYVLTMVAHGTRCEAEGCPSCETLHGIFEHVRSRIFSSGTDLGVTASTPGTRRKPTPRQAGMRQRPGQGT